MYDGNQSRGLVSARLSPSPFVTHHELHDVDTEVLILHRVQAKTSLTQPVHNGTIRRIDHELDRILPSMSHLGAIPPPCD